MALLWIYIVIGTWNCVSFIIVNKTNVEIIV